MRVTELARSVPRADGPRRIAIGSFDGVHRGHQAVIEGSDTVLTFDPHPLTVLQPDAAPRLLSPFALKRDLIAALGVDELVVIPFTREFAARGAAEFITDVLVDRLAASHVAVGENFRFGAGARGDAALLRSDGRFETRVVGLVDVSGETVSSSRIRELVEAGEVLRAGELLGRPFIFEGEVVAGDRRGRELGMPTANIVPDDRLTCPAHGVYAATVDDHAAAVNVGVRPTFDSHRGLLLESHLIDFSGDLYGRTLRVAFLDRIRDERRFESVDELVAQMRQDVEQARAIASATVPRDAADR